MPLSVGQDAFDVNLVEPGMNSGWIQIIRPLSRLSEYKAIETTSLHHDDFPNLQQFGWGPEKIASTPAEATSRLFVLAGSRYSDPEFSWRHVLAPATNRLPEQQGTRPAVRGRPLRRLLDDGHGGGTALPLQPDGERRKIAVDPRLEDRVADNLTFRDITESESLRFGTGFGIVTDTETLDVVGSNA